MFHKHKARVMELMQVRILRTYFFDLPYSIPELNTGVTHKKQLVKMCSEAKRSQLLRVLVYFLVMCILAKCQLYKRDNFRDIINDKIT